MRHTRECATDEIARDACEWEYSRKVDQILTLREAIRAVYALAGENAQVASICEDVLRETDV